jgi:fructose-1,6-bisphosphatase/sedoheptulose 1,7-bisphosphatase-like protein
MGEFMKSQKQNQGDLKEVVVQIEKKVAEDLELMSKNTGIPVDDIVVIALKRFRSSHLDYLKQVPVTE